ncbi:MAG: acetyl-CoA carboxylase, carboxyltransferase subunit beta [Turicibacter sp.]|nr:acetyl-CoA carboxylase, carboxyltransferase subunit beta [Turicibacter sp.]
MSSLFKERKEMLLGFKALRSNKKAPQFTGEIPDGLYEKCPSCEKTMLKEDIVEHSFVCPHCNHHFRLRAAERLQLTVDPGTFKELMSSAKSGNPLEMPGYEEKLQRDRSKTGQNEAVVTGFGRIGGYPYAIAVMDSYFLMGSMGAVVGEKITALTEAATKRKLPLIIFCTSGGARMQEGILSLMQMAKTSAAIGRHNQEGLLYIAVLTHPTTGGVSASFAMLGDITLAEPDALIGFAGPRVIEQTIKQTLPEGFQRSEFLQERGFVDKVVNRNDLKETIIKLSRLHGMEAKG